MTAPVVTADLAPKLYAVIDRRADGGRRIIGEYVEPDHARRAALLLRWAGTPAEIVLVSREDALAEADDHIGGDVQVSET